jgi:hypothetical protein
MPIVTLYIILLTITAYPLFFPSPFIYFIKQLSITLQSVGFSHGNKIFISFLSGLTKPKVKYFNKKVIPAYPGDG